MYQLAGHPKNILQTISVSELGEWPIWSLLISTESHHHHHHNRFMALFPGPPGWAGASRELLDFMVQGKISRGRHTRHLIRLGATPSGLTSAPPPPSSPYRITVGHIFAVCNDANSGVNRMKFITLATVPFILPLFQTEFRETRYKFLCWMFHICNGQWKGRFGFNISPPISLNIDATWCTAQKKENYNKKCY